VLGGREGLLASLTDHFVCKQDEDDAVQTVDVLLVAPRDTARSVCGKFVSIAADAWLAAPWLNSSLSGVKTYCQVSGIVSLNRSSNFIVCKFFFARIIGTHFREAGITFLSQTVVLLIFYVRT